jgi:hypothetical protein
MGLVVRLLAAAAILGGAATLIGLFLRSPEGVLPIAVMIWCLLILVLTSLLVVRSGWPPTAETSRLRLLAFSRLFVVVYGFVFLGGLILVIVAFAMM